MKNRVEPGVGRAGESHPGDREALEVAQRLVELIHVVYATREDGSGGRGPQGGDEQGRPAAVSPHAIRAAMHLWQSGTLTISELADGLGISLGWASRVVSELEVTGMVVRTTDPSDRRVVRVSLSDHAVDVVERAYLWRVEAIERALATIDPASRDAVGRFLQAAIDELSRVRDDRRAREGSR